MLPPHEVIDIVLAYVEEVGYQARVSIEGGSKSWEYNLRFEIDDECLKVKREFHGTLKDVVNDLVDFLSNFFGDDVKEIIAEEEVLQKKQNKEADT